MLAMAGQHGRCAMASGDGDLCRGGGSFRTPAWGAALCEVRLRGMRDFPTPVVGSVVFADTHEQTLTGRGGTVAVRGYKAHTEGSVSTSGA